MTVEPLAERKLAAAQHLRTRRLAMAAATYAGAILMTALFLRYGVSGPGTFHWIPFVGLALLINAGFFALIRTNLNLRFGDPSLTQLQIVVAAAWGMLPLYDLPEARPLVLMFYIPAFSFGMLRLSRREYLVTVGAVLAIYAGLLAVEYRFERPGYRLSYELFVFATFAILVTWFAFFGGFVSDLRRELVRKRGAVERAHEELTREMAARALVAAENERLIGELKLRLGQVKRLSGLLPICANCKKIRDDRGYWNQIESYLLHHSEAEFTHGICPECADELLADLPEAGS